MANHRCSPPTGVIRSIVNSVTEPVTITVPIVAQVPAPTNQARPTASASPAGQSTAPPDGQASPNPTAISPVASPTGAATPTGSVTRTVHGLRSSLHPSGRQQCRLPAQQRRRSYHVSCAGLGHREGNACSEQDGQSSAPVTTEPTPVTQSHSPTADILAPFSGMPRWLETSCSLPDAGSDLIRCRTSRRTRSTQAAAGRPVN